MTFLAGISEGPEGGKMTSLMKLAAAGPHVRRKVETTLNFCSTMFSLMRIVLMKIGHPTFNC